MILADAQYPITNAQAWGADYSPFWSSGSDRKALTQHTVRKKAAGQAGLESC